MRHDSGDGPARSSQTRGHGGPAFRGTVLAVALAMLVAGPAAAAAIRCDVRVTDDSCGVMLPRGLTHFQVTPPTGADNGRLVVLVAGYAVPMVVWQETVPALARHGFTVLRFDFYGRGRSARPDVHYEPRIFAEQLYHLVTELELPTRFDVVASSMGGIVTAVYANRHPHALGRIVLASPAGLSEKVPPLVTVLKIPGAGPWYFRHWFKDIMLDHLKDNVEADYRSYPALLPEFHRQLRVPGTADAMYSTLRRTLLRDSRDDFRGLGGLHRPTRVVWGTGDALVPFAESRQALKATMPHHQLCAVRRAGHLPQVEQPERFNALVTEFLTTPDDKPPPPCDPGPFE